MLVHDTNVKYMAITLGVAAVLATQVLETARIHEGGYFIVEVRGKGVHDSQVGNYCASRMLAERTARTFVYESKSSILKTSL